MLKKTLFILIVAFALTANALQICGPIDIRGAYDMGQIKSEIPISASIDGHALTIYINENVGIAHIVVTNKNGVYIDRDNLLHTPDVATLLIDDAGFYTVTITLHNGDVYSGDFMLANVVYCQVSWAEPILPPID